jgi:RHS repeat-associated protein
VDGTGAVVERNVYDPFGSVTIYSPTYSLRTSSSYGWQYEFEGLRVDSVTGSLSIRNRDYSPTLGQFNSLDPVSFAGGDYRLYGFEGNNPIASTDPLGMQPGTYEVYGYTVRDPVLLSSDPNNTRNIYAYFNTTQIDARTRGKIIAFLFDTRRALKHVLHHLNRLKDEVIATHAGDCACIRASELTWTNPNNSLTLLQLENYFACTKTGDKPCLSLTDLKQIIRTYELVLGRLESNFLYFRMDNIPDGVPAVAQAGTPQNPGREITLSSGFFNDRRGNSWRLGMFIHEVSHMIGTGDQGYYLRGAWTPAQIPPYPPEWWDNTFNKDGTPHVVKISKDDCLKNADSYGKLIESFYASTPFVEAYETNELNIIMR